MAKYCDVLSPMIYPSHFFGMDGVAHPGDEPEHFIGSSMDRFEKITAGTGVVLRPWLQAFRWRTKTYSPEYILSQVSSSHDHGGSASCSGTPQRLRQALSRQCRKCAPEHDATTAVAKNERMRKRGKSRVSAPTPHRQ